MNIIETLAKEFAVKQTQIESTVALIEDGNTIPFIARYRKETTGGLTDVALRNIDARLAYLKNLEERKTEIIRLIDEQGKLTEPLRMEIEKAEILQRVEDLYKPFKQKKATRASKARERGLEPLAALFMAQALLTGDIDAIAAAYIDAEKGVASAAEAIQGAQDIVAETIADDPEITAVVRERTLNTGLILSEAVAPEEKTVYEMYYGYQEKVSTIPNHRILAINRGEKEKKLKVKVAANAEEITALITKAVVTNARSIFTPLLFDATADAYKRLIAPSIERETRSALTERAEREAVKVFSKNTEKLLMAPPVRSAGIISLDPGYRTGCKVAVLDETGKLLAYATVYPTEPRRDIAGAEATLKKLIDKYKPSIIAIGNGTASRETEQFVAGFLQKHDYPIKYAIVNEAGASVYSASKLASEEYPDLDVATRGAMSLGRRLQDPLAELVKIAPKHIGVGQYQHDINQTNLDKALAEVVEDCVNRVGVDLNTASPSLLAYIAGVNIGIAKNIVAHRELRGRFTNRKELLAVPKLGEKTFRQCAGFLRIAKGDNPLDSTSVHPESYAAAELMLQKLGVAKDRIAEGGVSDIEDKLLAVYPAKTPKTSVEQLSAEIGVGAMTLRDIIDEMKKPARDPRENAPPIVFRKDVVGIEDLKIGMELTGTVRNVVDFGAFVDIGIKNDGLVHVSEMSNRFVKHPMDVVAVGDTVTVKILEIDHARQKTKLTMKQ